jgi:UDP-N-acetylglucosamine enolpyruvyl transferase
MHIPKGQLIAAIIATILIFAVATYCALPQTVFAQGKIVIEGATAAACKVVTTYEAPTMTITYRTPPPEAGVKVERRMETTNKPNLVWAPHPTTPNLPAQTMVFVDKATTQSATEDVTYHYRFFTVNDMGQHNGVPSDPVCITILRPLPQTPIVVMN